MGVILAFGTDLSARPVYNLSIRRIPVRVSMNVTSYTPFGVPFAVSPRLIPSCGSAVSKV